MNSRLFNILFFPSLLVVLSCNTPQGRYYLKNEQGEYINHVLFLNKDKTYSYVARIPDLGSYNRIYNNGSYSLKGNMIILNSFNQLKNDSFYEIKEYEDKDLIDSIKFILVNPFAKKNWIYGSPRHRIFINDFFELGGENFGRDSFSSLIIKKPNTELKTMDIEFYDVMYKRYYTKNKMSNVFEITFNGREKLDPFRNIYYSYFDNKIVKIKSSDTLIIEKSNLTLVKDKCVRCDTSQKFKRNFIDGIILSSP